ncbi:4'-phosphopantetheinyl transferase family protein [Leifsonia sp. SIMBA_070]|uniref:4'-phosphopantetheinyl transferase family protein n=1 Tax=Leifsonia sp. SIMBA_070 TaxID=3085810 RepID=UPI00397ACFD2
MPAFVVIAHGSAGAGIASRLSAGDRARLSALGDGPAAARFLAGRAALLAAAAAAGEPDIRIEAACPECGRSHGRPEVTGASVRLYLSLAHSEGAAFAVASRVPVGIDVEADGAPVERLAAIDELAPGRGPALRRWTAVEAVLKADGRGLRVSPGEVRVGLRSARLHDSRYRLRTTRTDGRVITVAERASGHPESDGSAV